MAQEQEFAEPQNTFRNTCGDQRTENRRASRSSQNSGQFRGAGRGGGRNSYARTRRSWNNNYDNSHNVQTKNATIINPCRLHKMVHILGHSADKTQIRMISKDECLQAEVVVSTQDNNTRAITTTVETILKAKIKIRTNHHRISIKTRSKIHPIKWWYTPQIIILVLPEERKVTLDRAPGTIMGNSSNQMALLLTYPVVH
jgi:hypothetical protein